MTSLTELAYGTRRDTTGVSQQTERPGGHD